MPHSGRLPGGERKAAIIRAASRLFAAKGFAAATTRELAAAAGVSEALLYRHFPTKDALYAAIHESITAACETRHSRLSTLEPCTLTLVLLTHSMVDSLARDAAGGAEDSIPLRLALRSQVEDGAFARLTFARVAGECGAKTAECLRAALAAGDLVEGAESRVPFERAAELSFRLAIAAAAPFLTAPAAPDPDAIAQAVWFVLRGLGLREDAARRFYYPGALRVLGAEFAFDPL